MAQIYPSETSHDFNNCNCESCKQIKKEEKEMIRLFCYPIIGIGIMLCLL